MVRHLVGLLALAGVVGLAGACNGPVRSSHLPAEAADSITGSAVDVVTAEHTVREYFAALAERRTEDAHALLAAGPRSDASPEQIEQAAAALRQVQVRRLDPLQVTGEQIVFQVTLDVEPDPAVVSEWRTGANTRWVEVAHSRRGWRISRVSEAPIGAPTLSLVTQWTQVHILEAEISLDVPHNWQMHHGRWAWSPPGLATSSVEIRWYDGAGPADVPGQADGARRVVRSAPVEVGWGSGTEYGVEPSGAAAGDAADTRYGIHFLVRRREGERTFLITGETQRREELRALRLVLRRMLTTMEFATPASLTAEPHAPR